MKNENNMAHITFDNISAAKLFIKLSFFLDLSIAFYNSIAIYLLPTPFYIYTQRKHTYVYVHSQKFINRAQSWRHIDYIIGYKIDFCNRSWLGGGRGLVAKNELDFDVLFV